MNNTKAHTLMDSFTDKRRKLPSSGQSGEIVDIGRLIGKRKKLLGNLGEALVVKHLTAKGFTHVQSNFQRAYGEIDVIMKQGDKLFFIEVKSVSRENLKNRLDRILDKSKTAVIRETSLHMPEENVSRSKLKKIARMVSVYLGEQGIRETKWQFDVAVVLIDLSNHFACIKFIRDIPLAS